MFVSAQEFLKKAQQFGFDVQDFRSSMWNLTDNPASLDVAKIQGRSPYLVHYADTDCISVTFLEKKHLPIAADDDNTLVDAFEMLRHVSH